MLRFAAYRKKGLRQAGLQEDLSGSNPPLDLLDLTGGRKALSQAALRGKQVGKRKAEADGAMEADMGGLAIADDGRMIIPDEHEDTKSAGHRFGDHAMHTEDDDEDGDPPHSARGGGHVKANGKGARREIQDGGKGKRQKVPGRWAYTGDEYAASGGGSGKGRGKAGGDVKKEGKLDPHAYWPLDAKMLNRRAGKVAAARKGMKNVLKLGGKRGDASEGEGYSKMKGRGQRKAHKGKGKGRA